MDPRLNSLLKWSIQNSSTGDDSTGAADTHQQQQTQTEEGQHVPGTEQGQQGSTAPASTAERASRGLNPEMLASLFGGPSEADLMKSAMAALIDPEIPLDDKMVAFDNFEQLIESLDNANNMEPLGLWSPLAGLLEHDEPDMRRMAAWCVGTAVQNNEKSQDKVWPFSFSSSSSSGLYELQANAGLQVIVMNVLPKLVKMATADPAPAARKKAVYAISSSVRNYQPAMDELVKHLPDGYSHDKIDAADMEPVDALMDQLRAHPCESA